MPRLCLEDVLKIALGFIILKYQKKRNLTFLTYFIILHHAFALWSSHQVILPSTMAGCHNTHNTYNDFILHTSNFIILKHQKKRNETPGDPAFYHGRLPQEALEVPEVTWASTRPPRHKVPVRQER